MKKFTVLGIAAAQGALLFPFRRRLVVILNQEEYSILQMKNNGNSILVIFHS